MKKISTLCITAFSIIFWMFESNAAVVTATGQDFSFMPSIIANNPNSQANKVTVAGSYDYSSFPQGISDNDSPVLILKNNTLVSNGLLQVSYDIPVTAAAQLQLYDILGKSVYTFFSARKPAGTYTETYSLAGLRQGIYFLQLETAAARVTRRIIVD